MDLWNIKNLDSPPISTYKVNSYNVDIVVLRRVLLEAINTFKSQKQLHEEAAILSRCIYRVKLKFRTDKGLKAMEKANHALLNYLRMNIVNTLKMFHDMVPDKYTCSMYLPTRNMLYYILVRIQGLSKLLVRIVNEVKTGAQFMQYRIGIGHFWTVAVICLGVCSRIFVLTRKLVNFCCKFYTQLLPFADVLKNTGSDWLPTDYHLPGDLKLWLDVEWLDKHLIIQPKFKMSMILNIPNIMDSDSDLEISGEYTQIDDDIEITNEYVEVPDNSNLKLKRAKADLANDFPIINHNTFINLTEEEDIGEIVDPSSISQTEQTVKEENVEVTKTNVSISKTNVSKKKKKKQKLQQTKPSINYMIANIKTLKDLKVFEKDFNSLQSTYPRSFKKIDKMQRNMLRSVLKKCIKKAKKHQTDQSKVSAFVNEAKEALSLSLT